MFCCFHISFHKHMILLYPNCSNIPIVNKVILVWNQISVLNTPLYCRKVTFVKVRTTVNTVVFLWFKFFGNICIKTHTLSYLSVNNYFLCRFFNMFVVITNESKIIMSIEQTLLACMRERVILCCAVLLYIFSFFH